MSKILSIVIPCYNKFNFTKSCIKDLFQLPDDHEIIIVDNASTDETEAELKNNPRIVYHKNAENLGFAKACNIGYGMSTAPNVLFLNNDIRVKSNFTDWTKSIIEGCATGLAGPTMGQLDDQLNFIKEADTMLPGKSYMSGWCLAASKDIWDELRIKGYKGPFSEEFGLAYFEDTDLSFRARALNIPMQVISVPVVHFGKQTSSQLNTRKLYLEAREIFVKKWKK